MGLYGYGDYFYICYIDLEYYIVILIDCTVYNSNAYVLSHACG